MTIDGPSVLLVQNNVEPGRASDFDAWHLSDHMPDRVGIPLFRRVLPTPAWRADADAGVVARALLRGDSEASQFNRVESRLRKSMDQTIDAAAWVEAATPEQARIAAAPTVDALRAAGVVAGMPVLLHLVAVFQRPTR
jgi:hypothetical protein